MAENENGEGGNQANPATAGDGAAENQPQVGILAQYVKDLSFENPAAPQSLQDIATQKPQIDVNVNVNARRIGEEGYEVELSINASAKSGDKNAFVVELTYAGLFGVRNVSDEQLELFLLIECPRLLFPFARRVIADATRDGGFPPLLLEPIDFSILYRQHKESQAGAKPDGAAGEATPTVN